MPAELPPDRREELLERVYRGGYRLRRINYARWATATVAALLLVIGIPALLLASPGNDKKTVHVADQGTTTVPEAGEGIVTPLAPDVSPSTTLSVPRVTRTKPTVPLRLPPPVNAPHWVPAPLGTTDMLRRIVFVDPAHGWIVGDNGTILATSESGTNWTRQSLPPQRATERIMDVSFVDLMHGWAVGWGGLIASTSDGGAHWVLQSAPKDPSTNSDMNYMAVSFVDLLHGWAVGNHGVAATTDGGAHWAMQLPRTDGGLGYGVHFIDARHGLASFSTGLMLTRDGGSNWTVAQAPPGWFDRMSFVDENLGWGGGPSGPAVTHDGGATWQPVTTGDRTNVYGVAALDSTHVWFTSGPRSYGATAQPPDYDPDSAIVSTADGANWSVEWKGRPALADIAVVDSTHGWALADGGTLLRYIPD